MINSRSADLLLVVTQDLVVDVVEHTDSQQDLVVVLVQMLAVLFVQVHSDVVLRVRHPRDADALAVTRQGRLLLLLLGLPAARDRV